MYRKLPQSHGNVLGYEVTDRITDDDVQEVATELQEAVDDFGTVNVLVRAPEMPDQKFAGTLGERLRLLTDDIGDVQRYALVTDDTTGEWVRTLAEQVLPVELVHFAPHREAEAWRWLAGAA